MYFVLFRIAVIGEILVSKACLPVPASSGITIYGALGGEPNSPREHSGPWK